MFCQGQRLTVRTWNRIAECLLLNDLVSKGGNVGCVELSDAPSASESGTLPVVVRSLFERTLQV